MPRNTSRFISVTSWQQSVAAMTGLPSHSYSSLYISLPAKQWGMLLPSGSWTCGSVSCFILITYRIFTSFPLTRSDHSFRRLRFHSRLRFPPPHEVLRGQGPYRPSVIRRPICLPRPFGNRHWNDARNRRSPCRLLLWCRFRLGWFLQQTNRGGCLQFRHRSSLQRRLFRLHRSLDTLYRFRRPRAGHYCLAIDRHLNPYLAPQALAYYDCPLQMDSGRQDVQGSNLQWPFWSHGRWHVPFH